MSAHDVDVLIVGGGPAGLSAAVELKRRGVRRVLLLEREPELGGIPRHCFHTGFGWFDLRRVLSGPSYAKRHARLARNSGADFLLETSVTGWETAPDGTLRLKTTGPAGQSAYSARAVLLATGCRERPRSARLIPGSRPAGVYTTETLQQLVHVHHQRAGNRAVILGAEHVSYSAVHTLVAGGTSVAAMITDLPRHQTLPPFKWLTAGLHGVPLLAESRIERIFGTRRVEGIEYSSLKDPGRRGRIDCDTVVCTGDWIPAHELARAGGLSLDPGTRGPRVDLSLRSTRPGVFAAGNLLHGAEIADVAALEGRVAAGSLLSFLENGEWTGPAVPLQAQLPIRWVSPNRLGLGAPHVGRFVFQVDRFVNGGEIQVRQGPKSVFSKRFSKLIPNRPYYFPSDWVPASGNATSRDSEWTLSLRNEGAL